MYIDLSPRFLSVGFSKEIKKPLEQDTGILISNTHTARLQSISTASPRFFKIKNLAHQGSSFSQI